ncbi:MAG: CheR family methyltransferase [Bacilli bacterium]
MDDYTYFIDQVKRKTGIDLGLYKESQMKRRLTSLYEKKGYDNFRTYFSYIDKNTDGLFEFLDRMTINVSEFYRNKKRWDVVEERILPMLLKEKPKLNIWSAACSTGEEPYTIALILSKYARFQEMNILATDIDENVLKRAQIALYPERSFLEMPSELKQKYFVKDESYFRMSNDVKKGIRFRKHNLLSDNYGKDFDFIVCRNVMIYFTDVAKHEIYQKFSAALRPGGILFVGSTEQIFNPAQYGLETYDTFFYRKK